MDTDVKTETDIGTRTDMEALLKTTYENTRALKALIYILKNSGK